MFLLPIHVFLIHVRLRGLCLVQEIVPKYFDGPDVGFVSGGVEQTTALLAEK